MESGITKFKMVTGHDIRACGSADKEYSETTRKLEKGEHDRAQGEYYKIAKELNVRDNVIFREGKFVIPNGKMRKDLIDIAHEGHLGLNQIKIRKRGTVYWPGMTKDIENTYRTCRACQIPKEGRHHQDKTQYTTSKTLV